MGATAGNIPGAGVLRGGSGRSGSSSRAVDGDWPNTSRTLPWLIAGFVTMLFLLPFDSTRLPIALPIDSQLDRFALAGLGFVWLVVLLGGREGAVGHRRSPVNVALLVFLLVATASLLVNYSTLIRINEFDLAVKKISIAASLAIFFYVVLTSVRRREVESFLTLCIALACVTAFGTIVEYRLSFNPFFDYASFMPGVTVLPPPFDSLYARETISGPTRHGLALTTLLALVMPFAMTRLLRAQELRERLVYAAVLALLLAGAVATLRKSALIAPMAGLAVVAIYARREIVRFLPFGVGLLLMVMTLSPGALGGIKSQFAQGSANTSTTARTDDYSAVKPDVLSKPLLGRGYGTYDPKIHTLELVPQRHRVIDNMLLILLIEVGILGLLAYLAIPAAVIWTCHRAARIGDLARAGPAIATVACGVTFIVANVLFDALAFPQVPYVFVFMSALGVIWSLRETPADVDAEAVR